MSFKFGGLKLLVAGVCWGSIPTVQAFQKFVDPLPIPQMIRVSDGEDITLELKKFSTKIHRDLPEAEFFGYGGVSPGPTLEVEKGARIRVHWKSALPTTHIYPSSSNGGMSGMHTNDPQVRTVTHLHGASVSEPTPMDRTRNNDGWPDAWVIPGQEQIAEYPNQQSARMLWYHDHAMGQTARNVYAGLFGAYFIRDSYERSLNLPSGEFEIPLVIQSLGLQDNGVPYFPDEVTAEFYGNALTVNQKLWPYLEVEPRKYRFRVLNASTSRTIALKFIYPFDQAPGPGMLQIGTDSGFLETPVFLNDPSQEEAPRLELAPAERGDVIVDFSKYAGETLLLHNNSVTDAGEGELPVPQVMEVRVQPKTQQPDLSLAPTQLRAVEKLREEDASVKREIFFKQVFLDNQNFMLLLNGQDWGDPITEKPILGSTEVWSIINPLPDIHPFHMHLVDVQILDRRPFDVEKYNQTGKVVFTGPAVLPDANEQGFKDTVRSPSGMVTRLIMRFEPFTGFYVYHCHLLEHEDMGMMRPFQVVAP